MPEEPRPSQVQRSRLMMWLASVAVVAVVLTSVFATVRAGLLLMAGVLAAFAVVRAVSPAPGPYGISIRSRAFDVTLLALGALALAAITLSLPAAELG